MKIPKEVTELDYELIYSDRKTLKMTITREGTIRMQAPYGFPKAFIEKFVREKQNWIYKKIEENEEETKRLGPPLSFEERGAYFKAAQEYFPKRVEYYANLLNVTIGRITIREQKTRWGSCSSKGNLNFNWRLMLAPEEVRDYVVLHEVAHRKEMNHSEDFWEIVGTTMPDYERRKQWLEEHARELWR